MLPLQTRARISGSPRRDILKVLTLSEFLRSSYEPHNCALWYDTSSTLASSRALEDISWGAVFSATGSAPAASGEAAQCTIYHPRMPEVIGAGDVIRLNERSGLLSVLYRRGSRSNSLLVTERCNSYCVMCSQPPLERNESGRLDALLQTIRLIDRTETTLGITGGEPTLLGPQLIRLLGSLKSELPDTQLHVLTNGRLFADEGFTREISSAGHPAIVWAIPLYSDAPEIHDYVVQRRGAFAETLHGLMNLAQESQRIELRIVLQRATAPRLPQLAHFIARNLTFVDHVAWMGLEPMGFAKPHWQQLWIEPHDYAAALEDAVEHLHDMRIPTSIYNLPLCVLPKSLRAFAVQSISDWKNSYLPECDRCTLKGQCAGFFSSATRKYLPQDVRPILVDAGVADG